MGDTPAGILAAELARLFMLEPTARATALAQHQDDGRGRCRVCTSGGQRGNLSFPCTIRIAAELAERATTRSGGGLR